MRDAMPSDFPAALGGLDESDLPVVSAGLPVGKGPVLPASRIAKAPPPAAAPPPAPSPAAASAVTIDELDFDLPSLPSDLPVARPRSALPAKPPITPPATARPPVTPPTASAFEADLPVRASAPMADLPARASAPRADLPAARAKAAEAKHEAFLSDLPVISTQDLPVRAAGAALPALAGAPAASLPILAASLPARADGRSNLPSPAASLPVRSQGNLPSPAATLPVALDSFPVPGADASGGGRSRFW